jgi:hypothetical protein
VDDSLQVTELEIKKKKPEAMVRLRGEVGVYGETLCPKAQRTSTALTICLGPL